MWKRGSSNGLSSQQALTRRDLREELEGFLKKELCEELRNLVQEALGPASQFRQVESSRSHAVPPVDAAPREVWSRHSTHTNRTIGAMSRNSGQMVTHEGSRSRRVSIVHTVGASAGDAAFKKQMKQKTQEKKRNQIQVDAHGNLLTEAEPGKSILSHFPPILKRGHSAYQDTFSRGESKSPRAHTQVADGSPGGSPRGIPKEGGTLQLLGYLGDEIPRPSHKFTMNGQPAIASGPESAHPRETSHEPLLVEECTTDLDLLPDPDQDSTMEGFYSFAMSFCVRELPLTVVSGCMVLLNVLCVGLDTDYRLKNEGQSPPLMGLGELLFCVFFVSEITIRMVQSGCSFFSGEGKYWNIFDLAIVSFQVFEQVSVYAKALRVAKEHDATFLKVLRLLRIARVMRLVRIFGLFDQLRQLVDSMVNSLSVLACSVIILFAVIYLFSIIFLQCILASDDWKEFVTSSPGHHFFFSVSRTIFTMFECVVGGVSWDDVISPLMKHVSPYLGFVFTIYIAFCMFAIMNMLTGFFVEQSMECFKEDRDYCIASQIRDIFLPKVAGADIRLNEVDWATFERRVQDPFMQSFLTELGLDADDAKSLFHVMDRNDSGALSAEEIVEACVRLRGAARTLDIALLRREVGLLRTSIEKKNTIRSSAITTGSSAITFSRERSELSRSAKGKTTLL